MKLKVEKLKKVYSGKTVLSDITFEVEERNLFALLGESGSGKSTVLKAITGLIETQAGNIILDGANITSVPTEERGIGYVFQSPLLFPHLTVKENIAFGLRVKKI